LPRANAGLAEQSFSEPSEVPGLSNQTFMLGIATTKQIIGARKFAHCALTVRFENGGFNLCLGGTIRHTVLPSLRLPQSLYYKKFWWQLIHQQIA
jgi:hypothetical protein